MANALDVKHLCYYHSRTCNEEVVMLGYVHCRTTRSQASNSSNASFGPNLYDPGRATRSNQNPFCTHFSKMRRSIYPTSFFCMNCEWWEREVDLCNKRVSRQSQMYSCKAKHYSWIVPRPLWTVSNNRMLTKEEAEAMTKVFHSDDKKKKKEKGKGIEEEFLRDDDTIRTVDEEDVEDHGLSSDNEDDEMLECQDGDAHMADTPATLGRGGRVESDISNDSRNDMFEVNDNPTEAKRARFAFEEEGDKLHKLQSKYNDLFLKSESLRKSVEYWKAHHNQSLAQSEIPVTEATRENVVDKMLNDVVQSENFYMTSNRKRFTSRNKFRRYVAQRMWNDTHEVFVSLRESFFELAVSSIRKDVYSPANVLRAMDMAGGQLSIEGLEVLRSCETKGTKYYRNSILPCSADIRRVGAIVEEFAKTVIPYRHGTLDTGGEFVEWVPEEMIAMVIKGFGLEEQAKNRSITIHQAMDGAQLSKNITHVTYSFKMADRGAFCPFSKKPLFGGNNDDASVQSRNNCFPLKIVMERESNQIVDLMRPIISAVKSLTSPGQKWMRGNNEPITAPLNSDMSATWKIFKVGGAAKHDEQPCHCCPILSDDLSHANVVKCSRYCKDANDVCYHQTFLSSDNITELQTHYNLLQSTLDEHYESYERLRSLSQMELDEDPGAPTGEGRLNDKSIHFDFEASNVTAARRAKYNRTINHEIRIRHMTVSSAPLKERQLQLREACMKEQSIRKLGIALRHGKKIESSKAFLSLHDAVPCILHLENRVGLKFFTMLLRAGLSNATSGATFAVQTAQGQRFDSFFQTVNDIMNTVVIGSVFYPGQWDCPKDKSKNEVGIICLDNNRTRKVINSFDLFIDLCIVEDDKKQQWKTCIDHYRKAMKLLRQKTNLSSGEIERFQSHVDAFFVIWVNLTGHEGVTNYIHMLASGHISEYLVYWGNLYDHSQQGWEAFNSLIKTFFFRRTGRGGAGNQGRGPKSRLRPIARWLSRRVIWMCGYDYHFIFEQTKKATQPVPVEEHNESEEDSDLDDDVHVW